MQSVRTQQGVAAIWMSLVLVPVMGFTFWAVEGTRYVQEKSRLEDASEAAALAVTMTDHEAQAEQMASDYVSAYVRDIQGIRLRTVREFQKGTPENEFEEYVQYTVDATTTHQSWFASQVIPSFEKIQDLQGKSIAKKYPEYLGDRDVDIVFVSDFSGSMNRRWQGHSQLYWLKDAIKKISAKILVKDEDEQVIKNRVAFVPFNLRVQDKINSDLICNSQLRYNNYRSWVSHLSYEEVDWGFWSQYSYSDLKNCKSNKYYCPERSPYRREEAKRIYNVMNTNRWRLIDYPAYIDYEKTVTGIFNNKMNAEAFHYSSAANRLYSSRYICSQGSQAFWTIGLSSQRFSLDAVQTMGAQGGTAVYQGILRGAQVMADGRPQSTDEDALKDYQRRLKMILILSDGEESPYTSILQDLVGHGMCDKIRDAFSDSEQPLYIGVLGINFKASEQSGFQACVSQPEEDIIDVNNVDDLIQKIEELIKRGARSGGNTKLYG